MLEMLLGRKLIGRKCWYSYFQ